MPLRVDQEDLTNSELAGELLEALGNPELRELVFGDHIPMSSIPGAAVSPRVGDTAPECYDHLHHSA